MNLARRGFLAGSGGLLMAPAIVKAEALMRIAPPLYWGDGLHDDTAALQAMLDRAGQAGRATFTMPPGRIYVEGALRVPQAVREIAGNRFGAGDRTVFLNRGSGVALRFSEGDHAVAHDFVVFKTTPLSERMLRRDAEARALRGVSWASLAN